ncbi:hypothetical protein ABBQ38_008212 [Trebouxia sp. C0009 RCD-2024]
MRDTATDLYFPADLRESPTEYKYFIDLPGVPKSDIKVQVDKDRRLIVCGERKKEEMDVSWRQQKQERRFGAFQRKFQLPEDADVNNICMHPGQGREWGPCCQDPKRRRTV